jgi:hypothetical protein
MAQPHGSFGRHTPDYAQAPQPGGEDHGTCYQVSSHLTEIGQPPSPLEAWDSHQASRCRNERAAHAGSAVRGQRQFQIPLALKRFSLSSLNSAVRG